MNNKSKELLSLFNENKIKILYFIYTCREDICGCGLVEKLDVPKNLISYHIKTMREIGVIEEVKCGKNKRYKITKSYLPKVKKILEILEIKEIK